MYRKARKIWMSDFMINGRKKGKVKLAPADIKGLKKVLIALSNGEAVGILPDQVADKGEGELANFFGIGIGIIQSIYLNSKFTFGQYKIRHDKSFYFFFA